MNWKKFFGDELHSRLMSFCKTRHLTPSAVVRLAVDKYIK